MKPIQNHPKKESRKVVRTLVAGVMGATLLAGTASAEIVRGTILSDGQPVEGAQVRLLDKNLFDTTDALGNFSIVFDETPILQTNYSQLKHSVFVRNSGGLVIQSPLKETAEIQLFSMNGRMLNTQKVELSAGTTEVPSLTKVPGVYIYRVRKAAGISTHRFICTGRDVASSIPTSSMNHFQPTTQIRSSGSVDDSISITAEGYYEKVMPVSYNGGETYSLSLDPVELIDGVTPGEWKIFSGGDSLGTIYVNSEGTAIDSASIPIRLECIDISDMFNTKVEGPLEIPVNGVVKMGDTLSFHFTENTVRGDYKSKRTVEEFRSATCNWVEQYKVGGALVTQMMEHNDHFFSHKRTTEFTNRYYSLSTPDSEHGKTTVYPNRRYYFHGETVRVTAVADSGYYPSGWKNLPSDSATATFVMTGDRTVEPLFSPAKILTYTVTNGSFVKEPAKNSFFPGDTAVLVSAPIYNGIGVKAVWSGDTLKTDGDTAWVLMDEDRTVSVDYPGIFSLKTNATNGTVKILQGQDYYTEAENDTVMVIAQPETSYAFKSWGGDTLKTSADTAWIVMDGNKTVSLVCEKARKLNIYEEGCELIADPAKTYFPLHRIDTVKLVAKKAYNFVIDQWEGDTLRTDGDTAWVVMDGDKSIQLTCVKGIYLVINQKYGSNSNEQSFLFFHPTRKDTAMIIAGYEMPGYKLDSWGQDTLRTNGDTAWVVMDTVKSVQQTYISTEIIWKKKMNKTYAYYVGFSEDYSKVYAGRSDYYEIFDKATGKMLESGTEPHFKINSSVKVYTADYSYSAELVNNEGLVVKNETSGATVLTIPGQTRSNNRVAISKNGTYVATHGIDSTIRVWEVATGDSVTEIPEVPCVYYPEALAFTEDESGVLVLRQDRYLEKYDLTGSTEPLFSHSIGGAAVDAAFSGNGKRLVSHSWSSGISIYDVESGTRIKGFDPQDGGHPSVGINYDGTEIVSGKGDTTVVFIRID